MIKTFDLFADARSTGILFSPTLSKLIILIKSIINYIYKFNI